MAILTQDACDIIKKALGRSLHGVASEPLRLARSRNVQLLYPEKARGSVRAMTGKLLMPDSIEAMRRKTSKLRLAKKSKGMQRFLSYFR